MELFCVLHVCQFARIAEFKQTIDVEVVGLHSRQSGRYSENLIKSVNIFINSVSVHSTLCWYRCSLRNSDSEVRTDCRTFPWFKKHNMKLAWCLRLDWRCSRTYRSRRITSSSSTASSALGARSDIIGSIFNRETRNSIMVLLGYAYTLYMRVCA